MSDPASPTSVKSVDTGRRSKSPPVSPRTRILRTRHISRTDSTCSPGTENRNFSRTNSAYSGGTDSMRRRTSSVSSMKRRASLSLPHSNTFRFSVDEKKIEELKKEEEKHDFSAVPWWTSKRLCLSGICFLGFFCLYAQRVNLSVAIVCMVRQRANQPSNHSSEDAGIQTSGNLTNNDVYDVNNSRSKNTSIYRDALACPVSPWKSANDDSGDFEWDKPLRGLILGAFFWGYTAMQIPSGWLSERFGPRIIISVGMFTVAILTILTPLFARGSPYLLLVARVLIGVGEATMYPGAQALWAKWSPPEERSRLVGFAFGGCQLGNALAFPIAGMLCDYGFDGGWPSVFYVIGTLAFLWCILWVVCIRNTPKEMPGIQKIELEYIEFSLGNCNQETQQNKRESKPWKAMFSSGAMWAILIANACGNYGAYMLLTQMPSYMKEVLHFDIKSVRMVVPALFLVITGYMNCWNQTGAVVLLTLSMAFCGFQFSSFFINHGDIAPKYAGTIFGITNTGASIPGIIAPYVVSAITQNKTQSEWLTAFYIAGVIYCFGALFYIVFAKGDIQAWAKDDEQDQDEMGTKMVELRGIAEEDNAARDTEDSVFVPSNCNHVGEEKQEYITQ
ncbi:hypothetical protein KUTeg_018751 [Tegillarca granosa]|uniref:Major facilitator superfamily (MFS) profile domain-containing protein n=1 Tax=Tegillarca granosa TaxID=220873 RepID=A0ABQ9EJJ7_TEGGR|nr:hypothetical protein KUTeg_018751 [Tegillarca granosa]